MGLHTPLTEMLVAEHLYRPIRGDVLFIGRQTVYLNESALLFVLSKHGIELSADFTFEYDSETLAASHANVRLISDRCLMRALGVDKLSFLDVSDYEGADVVCDLARPVPDELKNRFDFIYDGSCLDNIFNPAVALANMAAMLRPGGRLLSMEHASPFNNPYTAFSIGWFTDYFAINRFRDVRAYVGGFTDQNTLCHGPWHLWCAPRTPMSYSFTPPNLHTVIITLAEKGDDSTYARLPLQSQYRSGDAAMTRTMEEAVMAFSNDRPYFRGVAPSDPPNMAYVGVVGGDLLQCLSGGWG